MPLKISGISLFSAQSPPPITLPARTEEIAIPCFKNSELLKKEFLYESVINSAHALLLL